MRIAPKYLMLLLLSFLIAGCEGGGEAAKIPDGELRMKYSQCRTAENPSRLKAMACANYERECARRKKNGKRVCS